MKRSKECVGDRPHGYRAFKQLKRDTGIRIPDLVAMARNNDPFCCGSPTQQAQARWFAELWERFGYATGVHLRRVHYRLISQSDPRRHDGRRYENTETAWKHLCDASKYARYLGLVSPDAFEDHRNPAPHLLARYGGEPRSPYWGMHSGVEWRLPSIATDLAWDVEFGLPSLGVGGYGYDLGDQPYHLEVWIEKSTMDDVLLPVCQELGMNLVTSIGFQSVTSVVAMLKRLAWINKPTRIFYISDFDPAGDSMPTAVARQVKFWLSEYAPDADVKLTPLVLTREQVIAYRLPRTPIKESDLRRAGFEDRHGKGAVELDALEALHPGELARLVREAALEYRDLDL